MNVEPDVCSFIVYNLPASVDERALQILFEEHFGGVLFVKVNKQEASDTVASGYVVCEGIQNTDALLKDSLRMEGEEIQVDIARPSQSPSCNATKVVVTGLDSTYSKSDTIILFSEFGCVMGYEENEHGMVVIEFASISACNRAIAELDGITPERSSNPINVNHLNSSLHHADMKNNDSSLYSFKSDCTGGPQPQDTKGHMSYSIGDSALISMTSSNDFSHTTINPPPPPLISSTMKEYSGTGFYSEQECTRWVFRVSNLTPNVTIMHLFSAFSPYGYVIGVYLDSVDSEENWRGVETARVHMYGPPSLSEAILEHVHGRPPMEGGLPMLVYIDEL
mmetsp:Transcript_6284/g.9481  ORF Transcript_6284/g.9481 Transcript_6284/m.9481 type:complete len:336 (+) Transcript_6284:73-1080(+)